MSASAAPLLDLLAENDNSIDDTGLLSSSPRARIALSAPLTAPGSVPPAACRSHHELGGERILTSIVAVEHFGGSARWRASVTLWGRPTRERGEVALLLARQLLSGLGTG